MYRSGLKRVILGLSLSLFCMAAGYYPLHAGIPEAPLGVAHVWGAYERYRAARLGVYVVQETDSAAWSPPPQPGTAIPPVWREGNTIYPPALLNPDGTIHQASLEAFLRNPEGWDGAPLEPAGFNSYMTGELSLLEGLNATFTLFPGGNPAQLLAMRGTPLQGGKVLDVGLFSDIAFVEPMNTSAFQPWWQGGRHTFRDVIKYAVVQPNLEKARVTARNQFEALMKTHEPWLDHPGFMGYILLHEMVDDHNFTDTEARKGLQLLEDAIATVRSYDRDRPIVIFQNYAWDDSSRGSAHQALFSAELGAGWNVYLEETYPFVSTVTLRRWWQGRPVAYGYVGGWYYHELWQEVRRYRRLSLEMERYQHEFKQRDLKGPDPEWWIDIQTLREFRSLTDGMARAYQLPEGDLILRYRRPTRFEYRLQAYLALAAGARGVTAYAYNSVNLEDLQLQATPAHAYDIRDMYSSRPAEHWKPKSHGVWLQEGLVTPGFSAYGNAPPGNSATLRLPYSEKGGERNRPVKGGPVSPGHPDSPTIHGEEEWTLDGNAYPYDYVSELYAGLQELLPILRTLRWWWTVDGTEAEWHLELGQTPPRRKQNLRSELSDRNLRTRDSRFSTVADRFRLRAVQDSDLEATFPYKGSEFRHSPVVVGLFDDPSEPEAEYYFVVNARTNRQVGDRFAPADPVEFILEWHGLPGQSGSVPEVVWSSGPEETWVEGVASTGNRFQARVSLAGGGAVLLKLP